MDEHAYVIGDASGTCIFATKSALAMLGTDQDRLCDLRIADLSATGGAPDQLRERLEASSGQVDQWLPGVFELRCPDGTRSTVGFSLVRRPAGDVILRFEGRDDQTRIAPTAVRDILEAWRREEQAAAASTPGTPARLVAEAEIDRLRDEYQRVALELGSAFEAGA